MPRQARRGWALCLLALTVTVTLAAPADADARMLRERTALAAAETRAVPGDFVSECERVSALRMTCWLVSPGLAELVDGETGEVTRLPVEIHVAVFYRRGRLYTYMPLMDDRAVRVRKLMPRRTQLQMKKAMRR